MLNKMVRNMKHFQRRVKIDTAGLYTPRNMTLVTLAYEKKPVAAPLLEVVCCMKSD